VMLIVSLRRCFLKTLGCRGQLLIIFVSASPQDSYDRTLNLGDPCRRSWAVLAGNGGHVWHCNLSSVCAIVHEFCKAVRQVLMPEFIQLPEGDALREVVRGFQIRCGFPQCAGAIDGSHIPIIAPEENHVDYFNRKGWHSVLLQGVVDHQFW
jgi:hypothetical protein